MVNTAAGHLHLPQLVSLPSRIVPPYDIDYDIACFAGQAQKVRGLAYLSYDICSRGSRGLWTSILDLRTSGSAWEAWWELGRISLYKEPTFVFPTAAFYKRLKPRAHARSTRETKLVW